MASRRINQCSLETPSSCETVAMRPPQDEGSGGRNLFMSQTFRMRAWGWNPALSISFSGPEREASARIKLGYIANLSAP